METRPAAEPTTLTPDAIAALAQALAAAEARYEEAIETWQADVYSSECSRRVQDLRKESVRLRRDLALARGQEAAVVIDWPAPWDAGAPIPFVLAKGSRAILVFRAKTRATPGRHRLDHSLRGR